MSALTENSEYFIVHLTNLIVIISGSFEDHLAKVKEVMKWIQFDGLKWKINNYKFTVPKW